MKRVLLAAVGILLLHGVSAQASVDQLKAYKQAFPESKPKCLACHTTEKPKKEKGQHEVNAYGLKVLELEKKPTAATYKQAGPYNAAK